MTPLSGVAQVSVALRREGEVASGNEDDIRLGFSLPRSSVSAVKPSRTRGPCSLRLESKASALAPSSKAEALDSSGGG